MRLTQLRTRESERLLWRTIVSVLAMLSLPGQGLAQTDWSNSWVVRAGAATVQVNDSSGEVTGIPGSGVSVSDSTQLGLTASYFFNSKFALGILASTPFTHEVDGAGVLDGLGEIAEVTQLPPTVTLQYHFTGFERFKPFIGAGLNYTVFFEESASSSLDAALGENVDVSLEESFGFAFEVGVDIPLKNNWVLNLHAWYIDIDTTANLSAGPNRLSVDVNIDPLVYMIGIGRKF